MKYHTDGKGNYVMTAMEDTGIMQALTFVARTGRVDAKRVLVLRAASDYDQPRPGITAAQGLAENSKNGYTGYLPALESAWRVGNTVVTEITAHWSKYKNTLPGR